MSVGKKSTIIELSVKIILSIIFQYIMYCLNGIYLSQSVTNRLLKKNKITRANLRDFFSYHENVGLIQNEIQLLRTKSKNILLAVEERIKWNGV